MKKDTHKFSKIQSIMDFFNCGDPFIVGGKSLNEGGFGEVYKEKAKCKLCGLEIEGVSTFGAFTSEMMLIGQVATEHIELHKTQALLQTEQP